MDSPLPPFLCRTGRDTTCTAFLLERGTSHHLGCSLRFPCPSYLPTASAAFAASFTTFLLLLFDLFTTTLPTTTWMWLFDSGFYHPLHRSLATTCLLVVTFYLRFAFTGYSLVMSWFCRSFTCGCLPAYPAMPTMPSRSVLLPYYTTRVWRIVIPTYRSCPFITIICFSRIYHHCRLFYLLFCFVWPVVRSLLPRVLVHYYPVFQFVPFRATGPPLLTTATDTIAYHLPLPFIWVLACEKHYRTDYFIRHHHTAQKEIYHLYGASRLPAVRSWRQRFRSRTCRFRYCAALPFPPSLFTTFYYRR